MVEKYYVSSVISDDFYEEKTLQQHESHIPKEIIQKINDQLKGK